MSPAILIERLTKRYGTLTAVDGLTLRVEPGSIYGLVGPDGAGKTTTLRCLVGAVGFNSGSLRVAGFDVPTQTESVRQAVGYMPQRFSLYGDLTMMENLLFFSDLYQVPPGERGGRIESLLKFSRLGGHESKPAAALSGGMKQKLALMSALVHQPRVLILDEPSTGVDPVSRGEFWRLLLELRDRGTAILVTTPYMDEAAKCSRVGLMAGGRLLKEGTPAELLAAFPFQILKIRVSPLFEAKKVLAVAPGIRTAVMHGEVIHAVVDDLEAGQETIHRLLSREALVGPVAPSGGSFDLGDITPAQPSLEDVFIAEITARGLAQAGLRGGAPDVHRQSGVHRQPDVSRD